MSAASVIRVRDLRVRYGAAEVIHGISFDVRRGEILGVIGPAQSGKTSLLRCLNRTLEFTPGARMEGLVEVDGEDVAADPRRLRPAPQDRHGGAAAGRPAAVHLRQRRVRARAAGLTARASLDDLVERCLTQAALWDEVKDRLHSLGTKLSGGQQQRLTIARALSHRPRSSASTSSRSPSTRSPRCGSRTCSSS